MHTVAPAAGGPVSRLTAPVRQMAYDSTMAEKTERLNLRLTPAQNLVLRRAAQARGESTSDYVLRNAVAAAETDLADRRVFVADETAWGELQGLVSGPSQLPLPMTELVTRPPSLG